MNNEVARDFAEQEKSEERKEDYAATSKVLHTLRNGREAWRLILGADCGIIIG